MALIPIKLPAGVYRTGTDFEGSGRWRDANLVRWTDGSMRPIGGWQLRKDTALDKPARAMHTWTDNSNDPKIALGLYDSLQFVSPAGVVSDITPAGLTAGNADAQKNLGFGGSFFGTGYFGVQRPSIGLFLEADSWALDNWGEYLVGCLTSDGKIYEWQLNTGTPAALLSNAPTSCKSIVVTEERFIFALQAGGNPRKVAWCDREDNTVWTPAATNEAGDIELQTSGEIMCGVRMRGRTLILTTIDAHIATYQGPPYVYGFERVGTACGIVSRKAVAAVDQGAFWMGKRGFFAFDGSVATEIDCEVSDYVFSDINQNQISKTFAVHNSQFGEIWWFYPSNDSTENNRYVVYDYKEGHWEFGQMNRTCGADRGSFDMPIWCDEEGILYNHESGTNHGGLTAFAESGPISLGNGDQIMKVTQLIPDEGTQGQVEAKFKTRFYPNGDESEHGAFQMGTPTSVRFSGRQVRMRIESTGSNDWRVGVMRLNVEAGGRR